MTTVNATPVIATSRRSRRAIAARIGLWTVRIMLAAQLAMGGALKLADCVAGCHARRPGRVADRRRFAPANRPPAQRSRSQ